MSETLEEAAETLKHALEFYDRVQASPPEEQEPVGRDHYDWVFEAARGVVEALDNNVQDECIPEDPVTCDECDRAATHAVQDVTENFHGFFTTRSPRGKPRKGCDIHRVDPVVYKQ